MNWPEYVTTHSLQILGEGRRMSARQVADSIISRNLDNPFYAQFRINDLGWSDMRLIRRVKEILRTHATYPRGNARLRTDGRCADGIIYTQNQEFRP